MRLRDTGSLKAIKVRANVDWSFTFTESLLDGRITAYFRGRKLHGRVVKLPSNYHGSILRVTDTNAASNVSDGVQRQIPNMDEDEEMEDDEEQVETRLAEELARFDEFTVWDHEVLSVATEDPYLMVVEEWIGLAEAVGNSARIKAHY